MKYKVKCPVCDKYFNKTIFNDFIFITLECTHCHSKTTMNNEIFKEISYEDK